MISAADATQFGLKEDQVLTFSIGPTDFSLPVKIHLDLKEGLAALPAGLSQLPYAELPAWALLKLKESRQMEKVM
jgi:hypothetical protein